MIGAWVRRTSELHGELRALAEVEPTWWLLAGGAAVAERLDTEARRYLISDAEPWADTFIGYRVPDRDPIVAAIARAHAARTALRELDGKLPEQPLAVSLKRTEAGVIAENSALDVIAIAIGKRVWWATLAPDVDGEVDLVRDLADAIAGRDPARVMRAPGTGATPFVTLSLGEEPTATARHGHRRGWAGPLLDDEPTRGPWLGLGRAGGMDTVSTCHFAVDGYGHAWVAARIAELAARYAPRVPHGDGFIVRSLGPSAGRVDVGGSASGASSLWPAGIAMSELPPLAPIAGAIPLGVAWRALDVPAPRALAVAYRLGCMLHERVGRPSAKFSPTLQIPVAPGRHDDPERRLRRVVQALSSVRFDDGTPEPFEAFDARTTDVLAREADGRGLVSRLLAASRAAPMPLVWKRRAVGLSRPKWLDRVADVMGGRACMSKIKVDAVVPPSCAVSSPARLATDADPLGACVATIVDDGQRAALTICGTGFVGTDAAASAVLDELLARL